jgi:predicted glycoside hydrolase/deacetylase ChbG (UPF0249 family)
MVNAPYTKHAIKLAKKYKIPIGLHFNITQFKALTDGRVLKKGITDFSFILSELKEQVNFFKKNNLEMLYIDSHHNIIFENVLLERIILKDYVMERIKKQYNGNWSFTNDEQKFKEIIYSKCFLEIGVHISYKDKKLKKLTKYYEERINELKILLNNKEYIKKEIFKYEQ